MKKLILAALAVATVAAPAAAAPGYHRGDRGGVERMDRGDRAGSRRGDDRRFDQTRRMESRRWRMGERFDGRYDRDYIVIQNPRAYRLHAAPRGYRWIRSGHDAILVALATGLIASVLPNSF